MKKLLFISSIIILFSCNSGNNQVEENPLVLDFPNWTDTVVYVGCEDVLSKTPEAINFSIYEDTIIPLNQFDNRLEDLKLKFNWLYEVGADNWPNTIGVSSFDILKNDKLISSIDLKEIIKVEAFMDNDPESKRFEQPVRDDIYMTDVNFDSYLDIKIRSSCGKGCYYSYWIYNPDKEIFEFKKELNYMRTYYIDCNNNIIYSYQGGTAWYYYLNAYKINNGQIEFYQSLYQERNGKYSLERYKDANDSIIFTDTIYND